VNATHSSPALQPQSGSINSLNPGQNTLGAPDRFNAMGGSPSAGGPGTPNRHGQLPPSVIISPSAPVS
jgi:serine/threonine-protein phosphatase 2A regulatory subunit B'